MPEIPVTYKCWGCGAMKVEYEAIEIEIPAIEVWDLCPDCQGQVIIDSSAVKKFEFEQVKKRGAK